MKPIADNDHFFCFRLREADKRTVFSVLKKSERDKKKLMETVLRQLRQLLQSSAWASIYTSSCHSLSSIIVSISSSCKCVTPVPCQPICLLACISVFFFSLSSQCCWVQLGFTYLAHLMERLSLVSPISSISFHPSQVSSWHLIPNCYIYLELDIEKK